MEEEMEEEMQPIFTIENIIYRLKHIDDLDFYPSDEEMLRPITEFWDNVAEKTPNWNCKKARASITELGIDDDMWQMWNVFDRHIWKMKNKLHTFRRKMIDSGTARLIYEFRDKSDNVVGLYGTNLTSEDYPTTATEYILYHDNYDIPHTSQDVSPPEACRWLFRKKWCTK